MENKIISYQKSCFNKYKEDIEYADFTYLYGTPINPLVPIETTVNKVMIVGAYPSAKFYTVEKIIDSPLADNDSPFSNESYFDGSRTRTIPSGKELNEVILAKIGVKREDCWITDLVKVFLFKEGHIKRYKKILNNLSEEKLKRIGTNLPQKENRSKFEYYAKNSIPYLREEVKICNPYVIILLGVEVIQAVFDGISKNDIKKDYLTGIAKQKIFCGEERNFICLPHPGILMKRNMPKNDWPQKFDTEISINAKQEIEKLRKNHIFASSN